MLSEKAQKVIKVALANNPESAEVLAELAKIEVVADKIAAVAEIADPSAADAEEVALKVNELIAALKA
jgi:hypothetical protein